LYFIVSCDGLGEPRELFNSMQGSMRTCSSLIHRSEYRCSSRTAWKIQQLTCSAPVKWLLVLRSEHWCPHTALDYPEHKNCVWTITAWNL